jgi:hypothetical protein
MGVDADDYSRTSSCMFFGIRCKGINGIYQQSSTGGDVLMPYNPPLEPIE